MSTHKKYFFALFLITGLFSNVFTTQCPGYKNICWGSSEKVVRTALNAKFREPLNSSSVYDGGCLFLSYEDFDGVIFKMLDIDTSEPYSFDPYVVNTLDIYVPNSSFKRYNVKENDLVVFFKGRFFCYETYVGEYETVEEALIKKYGQEIKPWKDFEEKKYYNVSVRIIDGTRILNINGIVFYFDDKVLNEIKQIVDKKLMKQKKQQNEKDKQNNLEEKNKLDNL